MEPARVAIGVDSREVVGYHVACHSIMRRASIPVTFVPIALPLLKDVFTRARDGMQSTEFSFSRFLTPYLMGYRGWALFVDCDIVMLDDIARLWAARDDRYAVLCVKHDHRPTGGVKFLGEVQTRYDKKNWSSVMLMNLDRCTALTPEYVNGATGLELHRFKWLESDDLIGELDPRWNHLVGYSEGELRDQTLLHYTDGGPYFSQYRTSKWAEVWHEERDHMLSTVEKSLAAVSGS